MPIKHSWSSLWAVAVFASVGLNVAHAAPLMIVGNDEKLLWDDNGKPIISPAGKELGVNRRSCRAGEPEDRRKPAAEELGRGTAAQRRH